MEIPKVMRISCFYGKITNSPTEVFLIIFKQLQLRIKHTICIKAIKRNRKENKNPTEYAGLRNLRLIALL